MIKHDKPRKFIVKLNIPHGVTLNEMEEYIKYAVSVWKGSLCPEDPMFNLDPDSISCERIRVSRMPKKPTPRFVKEGNYESTSYSQLNDKQNKLSWWKRFLLS